MALKNEIRIGVESVTLKFFFSVTQQVQGVIQ